MFSILALLVLLSLSASGLPTNGNTSYTVDVVHDNITDISGITHEHWFNPLPTCDWAGAPPGFYMPGDCRCWGKGNGVDHQYLDEAIKKACKAWTGGIGDPVAVYGLGPNLMQGRTNFYYYYSHNAGEEDRIASTMQVVHDFDNCLGPIRVTFGYCMKSLRAAIDACNTQGLNGKQGGYLRHNCISWVSDPNFNTNWPYSPYYLGNGK